MKDQLTLQMQSSASPNAMGIATNSAVATSMSKSSIMLYISPLIYESL
jgi:hypothetical protein